jgi:uncharacterized protein (DUF952 family)
MPDSVSPPATAVHLEKTGHTTYHLTPRDQWEAQAGASSYVPEGFANEGFIHCTDTFEEILAVGNRYYREDRRSYLLLAVDCGAVSAPIVYEDPSRIFPHIYGPLEVEAVSGVHQVDRDATGRFLSIDPIVRSSQATE